MILELKHQWYSANNNKTMKILINIILTAALSFAFGLFLPWWSIAIASFLVALAAGRKQGLSVLAGFLGVFLLWGIIAFVLSSGNEHILAHRMSMVILKKDDPIVLILVTAVIGGAVSAAAAWCGASVRGLSQAKD